MKLKMKIKVSGEIFVETESNSVQHAALGIEESVRQLNFGDLENVAIDNVEFVDQ